MKIQNKGTSNNLLLKCCKVLLHLFLHIFLLQSCSKDNKNENQYKLHLISSSQKFDSAYVLVEKIDSINIIKITLFTGYNNKTQKLVKYFRKKENYYEIMHFIENENNVIIDTNYVAALVLKDTITYCEYTKYLSHYTSIPLPPPDLNNWKYTINKINKNLFKLSIQPYFNSSVIVDFIDNGASFFNDIYYDTTFTIKEFHTNYYVDTLKFLNLN